MHKYLSSIKVTFFSLCTLVGLLLGGITIYTVFNGKTDIEAMNHTIIWHWFAASWKDNILLTLWLILITTTAAVLFINLVLCTFTKQLKSALKIKTVQKWLFFTLHFFFIIVLACHGLSMVTGHKTSSLVLYQGDEVLFQNRYKIKINTVSFKDDPALLQMAPRKSRKEMTRNTFHIKSNFADISLFDRSTLVLKKKLFILHPVKWNGLQITLSKFTAEKNRAHPRPGIDITITRDTLKHVFFTAYGLLILTMAGFTLATWTITAKETNSAPQYNHLNTSDHH